MTELNWEATEQEIRAALIRHGYDPDLEPRGINGPPGAFHGYKLTDQGVVPVMLRNHVCALDGIAIDGHSDPDFTGMCIHCLAEMP